MILKVWEIESNPILCEAVNAVCFVSVVLAKSHKRNVAVWFHAASEEVLGKSVRMAGIVKSWDAAPADEHPSCIQIEAPFAFACRGVMVKEHMLCTVRKGRDCSVTTSLPVEGLDMPGCMHFPHHNLIADFSGEVTDTGVQLHPPMPTIGINASKIGFYRIP